MNESLYNSIEEYIEDKHKKWLERGDTEMEWNEEGIAWALQDYYGSNGGFSEEDWNTLEKMGLSELAAWCCEEE